jgi:lysyl endopeptidase
MAPTLRFALASLLLTATLPSLCQIAYGGKAFGLMEHDLDLPAAPLVTMPAVDSEAMLAEDELRYADGRKGPYRFGVNHATDLSLENSGVWHEMPNGDRLWRLSIECPGAYSINFEFHDYHVPYGGLVFVYNEAGRQLGAFMAGSNGGKPTMGVTQLPGDRITVEYYEPLEVSGEGRLRIGQVTHAYVDLFKISRGLGDSGPCNINVICPEGDDWRDQIRSTAIITAGGNGFCTGTLINNCAEDGTPYFLTADHCLDPGVENWVFRFNWDSPVCDPTENGPLDQTVSGCELLVNSAATDVALLLLSAPPPPDYDVYYSGWNRTDVPAERVTCIHHPAGDIKKISHAEAPVEFGTFAGADCWRVPSWDAGTTEPGSSGSGLWNENGLLVGQLFGGAANCNNNLDDYYGRLDVSWPLLEQWLGSCGDTLVGLGDDIVVPITYDAAVTSITNVPVIVCGSNFITPRVTLKNNGIYVVTSIILLYGLVGEPPAITVWTGSLQPGQTVNYDLPPIAVTAGEYTLEVTSNSPNGEVDQVPDNDTWSYDFIVSSPAEVVTLYLTPDNYGSDITWELISPFNTVLYSGGPYPNGQAGQTITVPFCLTNGCYTFQIVDLFGDGICCANGQGGYVISNADGLVYAESDGQYGDGNTDVFCLAGVSVEELADAGDLTVFPNPTNGLLNLRLGGTRGMVRLQLTDGLGRVVEQRQLPAATPLAVLDLSGQAHGIYLLIADHDGGRLVRRVVVQR